MLPKVPRPLTVTDNSSQKCVFGVLSFTLFPTLLTLILRQMPLASKSQMYLCDLGFLVSVTAETREGVEPVALLWSDWDESSRGPAVCGQ